MKRHLTKEEIAPGITKVIDSAFPEDITYSLKPRVEVEVYNEDEIKGEKIEKSIDVSIHLPYEILEVIADHFGVTGITEHNERESLAGKLDCFAHLDFNHHSFSPGLHQDHLQIEITERRKDNGK